MERVAAEPFPYHCKCGAFLDRGQVWDFGNLWLRLFAVTFKDYKTMYVD